jgi:hypothetical protein
LRKNVAHVGTAALDCPPDAAQVRDNTNRSYLRFMTRSLGSVISSIA